MREWSTWNHVRTAASLASAACSAASSKWYRRKAQECGGAVLELGAGTGRVTLALAQDGVSVHALDSHQDMLGALRRKVAAQPTQVRERVIAIEQDMRAFRLEARFALVIAPFRTLLHNLTEDDQLACFQCVREHLGPGGRFAFNVFHPSLEYMAQHTGDLAGVWRWVGTHRLELSYLYPADIQRLLARTGFRSVEIAGGFDGRPFERDTDELVVEARVD